MKFGAKNAYLRAHLIPFYAVRGDRTKAANIYGPSYSRNTASLGESSNITGGNTSHLIYPNSDHSCGALVGIRE